MITDLNTYWAQTMDGGTPEAKSLLQMEALFAGTEAKILSTQMNEKVIQERLICLLIAHRSQVIASYLMERASGVPVPADGPGPVVPNIQTSQP